MKKKPIELTVNQKIWMQVETVFAITQRARDLELAKIGLNVPQAMVLYHVKTSPEPVTPMKLARIMYKQPHTVSALIHRMEAKGLIKTKHDLKRKNWLRIAITAKGEETLQRWPEAATVPDIMGSALSKEDFEALAVITKKLHTAGIKALRQMEPNPYDEVLFW
ncbi:MAG: winged helix-turn-helix transcriptional regulator [Dehalococcoidia bacterium]|nr:winged helix-turn-helix transcriptional regulator [Dehalococcoidia bacterium]